MNLAYPPGGRPLGRLQRLLKEAEKTDLILCTESQKSGLTESADRSIAREGHRAAVALAKRRPPRRLDKQCLLIEVRLSGSAKYTPIYTISECSQNRQP